MTAADDTRLYEWAEFNLPAELQARPRSVSPLARRVIAAEDRPTGAAIKARGLSGIRSLLLPFGFRTLPKS